MQDLNTIVVDDELLARQYLIEMLKYFNAVKVIKECKNGFEAVEAIVTHQPQLVFLDIQMPKMDGFEVLELIDTSKVAVVFTTAHEAYALKAFDNHAVDYLLKPFSKTRLEEALEKVKKNMGLGIPNIYEIKKSLLPESGYLTRLVIKDNDKIQIIPVKNISHFFAQDDYYEIVCENQTLLKHGTLLALEQQLDPIKFIRIHRSHIINSDYLDQILNLGKDSYQAVMKNKQCLKISRNGFKKIKDTLDQF